MKKLIIFILCSSLSALSFGQKNVGIGLTSPASRLHIHQADLINDPASALQFTNVSTGSTSNDGILFFLNANDAYLTNRENGNLSFGTNNLTRLTLTSTGKMSLNTATQIGLADFTLRSTNTGFGGMYVDVQNATGQPFYGYAINGASSMYHYYSGNDNTWRVYNNGERLLLKNNGNFGIGELDPQQKLVVDGKLEIGTDVSAATEGAMEYKNNDFRGYDGSTWKSFTKVRPEDAMSYDENIDFEMCAFPTQVFLNSGNDGSTFNFACGVLYDSGGPGGNYSINENNKILIGSSGSYDPVLVIIDELILEEDFDTLIIGNEDDFSRTLKFYENLSEPDTFIMNQQFFIQFKSDNSNVASGFKIRWEFIDDLATEQKAQYTGYFYDFNKQSLAAGLNEGHIWDKNLGNNAIAFGTRAMASRSFAVAVGGKSKALGIKSTAIGHGANASYTGSTAVGRDAKCTSDDQVILGNTGISQIGGYQGWSNLSDGRFKVNVKEDIPGLSFINDLRPVTYNLDVVKLNDFIGVNTDRNEVAVNSALEEVRTGFIAQEVMLSAEKMNYNFNGVVKPKNDQDHYSLRYAEFVVPLVKAVQELSAENEKLKQEISKFKDLEARLEALEEENN